MLRFVLVILLALSSPLHALAMAENGARTDTLAVGVTKICVLAEKTAFQTSADEVSVEAKKCVKLRAPDVERTACKGDCAGLVPPSSEAPEMPIAVHLKSIRAADPLTLLSVGLPPPIV